MEQLIIDVREPSEYIKGHAPGAINIPPATLLAGLPEVLSVVPKDAKIILYCLSGARSGASMRILEQYGFTNLINGINKDHVVAKYL